MKNLIYEECKNKALNSKHTKTFLCLHTPECQIINIIL